MDKEWKDGDRSRLAQECRRHSDGPQCRGGVDHQQDHPVGHGGQCCGAEAEAGPPQRSLCGRRQRRTVGRSGGHLQRVTLKPTYRRHVLGHTLEKALGAG
jgi:hypothetical protein